MYSQVIAQAVKVAAASLQTQERQRYFVLMLLTDGMLNDMVRLSVCHIVCGEGGEGGVVREIEVEGGRCRPLITSILVTVFLFQYLVLTRFLSCCCCCA